MGLDDREYVRREQPGFFLGGDRSMVTNIILLNVGIFIADQLFVKRNVMTPFGMTDVYPISDFLALKADLFRRPWNVWQLLTCGFAHDPSTIWHVTGNMVCLFIFGREMEGIYGRKEFLRLYLSLIVLSSLVWVIVQTSTGKTGVNLLGASGGVFGIMVLYVLHYPRRTFLFWGIFPVPAWVLCGCYLAFNILGFLGGRPGDNTAYVAHLAGAAFAYLYRRTGWNLGRMLPSVNFRNLKRKLSGSPRLKIHEESPPEAPESLQDRLDTILDKITREGKDSLSREEQSFLEDASRRYQKRRQ